MAASCLLSDNCVICIADNITNPYHVSGSAACRWTRFHTILGFITLECNTLPELADMHEQNKADLKELNATDEEHAFFLVLILAKRKKNFKDANRFCPALYADLPIGLEYKEGLDHIQGVPSSSEPPAASRFEEVD